MKITNPNVKGVWATVWYWWPLAAVGGFIVWAVERGTS